MPSQKVRYWFKTDITTFVPLACTRRELYREMVARDLLWCDHCKAAVEPEGRLDATGLSSFCPWCGKDFDDD